MNMRYTYDAKKRAANLKKHGYDFEEAPPIFENTATVTFEDKRFSYTNNGLLRWGCCVRRW
jgi:uncharacterized DUF497 family protein